MMKIVHIINPVLAPVGTELSIIQPITFETMRAAKMFASSQIQVELCAVCFEEDRPIIPDFFNQISILQKSVRDIGNLSLKKKLPFIKEILELGSIATDAEWIIYTNADICLMPHFYLLVQEIINDGHDAALITRRRISKKYNDKSQIPFMYSEIGGAHPGYDCFIFHRSLVSKFLLDGVCIGVPFIEVSLLHNFIAFATKLRHIDNLHLTFHIGMEVMPPIDRDLYDYNRNNYEENIKPKLIPKLKAENFPNYHLPFFQRILKGMLNPCYSTALLLELEGKSLIRKIKILLDELRWRIISR